MKKSYYLLLLKRTHSAGNTTYPYERIRTHTLRLNLLPNCKRAVSCSTEQAGYVFVKTHLACSARYFLAPGLEVLR